MVSFQNKAEEDHVLALLPKNKDHYWIGYNDMEKEGNFVWSDGSYYQPKYENWADGEPNDKDNNEDCTELVVASKNKKWNDSDCAVKRKFVCQIPSTGNLINQYIL